MACGAAGGCTGESTPGGRPAGEEEAKEDGAASVTPAVYQTTLAFLGFGQPPTRLFFHFENRTDAATLETRYAGWSGDGEAWRTVLDVRESLTVPRAAWRILPVGPLRVTVADGEELAGLAIDGLDGRTRMLIGERLAEWASATGQRESLRRAVVEMDGSAQGGILLGSQTARVAGTASHGAEDAILLADTLGNALVILRSEAAAEAQVVVHSLLDERSRRWDGAELDDSAPIEGGSDGGRAAAPDSAADPDTRGLALSIPGAGIEARIGLQSFPGPAGVTAGPELLGATGVLTVNGGEPRAMSGFRIVLSGDATDRVEP